LDIRAIVKELKRERDRLSRAIGALEDTDSSAAPRRLSSTVNFPDPPPEKVNRLTPAGRKRLSDMMKKRWAEKRKRNSRGGK